MAFITCKSVKPMANTEEIIVELIKSDTILSRHFNGFQLFNLTENKNLIAYNEDLLFTPASNIKLLTYLTCLHILEDSISSYKYKSTTDTIFIIPQGDPSFLNSNIDSSQLAFKFLLSQKKTVRILKNFQHDISALGTGWAWDDSQFSFQCAISFFPLFGNRVTFKSTHNLYDINIEPPYFKIHTLSSDTFNTFIKKDDFKTKFYINDRFIPKSYKVERPFITSNKLTKLLLQDTLHQNVDIIETGDTYDWPHFKSVPSDSLYKKILLESDNHVAEQLLLLCSNKTLGYMNTNEIIKFSIDSILNIDKHDIKWVDGSGLSRYNLVSPQVFINVLKNIYKKVGLETIKQLLPAGGNGDTLPSIFYSEKDWIYAKTGTLSNNFSVSGYIVTDKKQVMAFSFLNNHYITSKKEVSESLYKILKKVKNNY